MIITPQKVNFLHEDLTTYTSEWVGAALVSGP